MTDEIDTLKMESIYEKMCEEIPYGVSIDEYEGICGNNEGDEEE